MPGRILALEWLAVLVHLAGGRPVPHHLGRLSARVFGNVTGLAGQLVGMTVKAIAPFTLVRCTAMARLT